MSEPIWFPDKPIMRPVGGRIWEMHGDYIVPVFGNTMLIPDRFRTDLASVPKIFAPLIDEQDCGYAAPIAHDALYQWGGCYSIDLPCLSRRQADKLFRDLMGVEGVPAWRRHTAWLAVRLAGWACWRKGKKGERHV